METENDLEMEITKTCFLSTARVRCIDLPDCMDEKHNMGLYLSWMSLQRYHCDKEKNMMTIYDRQTRLN